METGPNWPSAVVALGFLALVGVMFWKAAEGNFAEIWAGVGTVVGVVTGVIPAYFFRQDAKKASARAEAIAAAAAPEAVEAARQSNPNAFR
jgi:hypothetical protein